MSAVRSATVLRSFTTGDGTAISVALLVMRQRDRLVLIRIRDAEGRSRSIRLSAFGAATLLGSLTEAIRLASEDAA